MRSGRLLVALARRGGPQVRLVAPSKASVLLRRSAGVPSLLPLAPSRFAREGANSRSWDGLSKVAGARRMSSLPSHTSLMMPALSPTMTQGNITTYKVKVGDRIAPGDLICDIESDKATIGWEAQEEGYVAAIIVPEMTNDVKVGAPVLILVDDQSSVAAFANYKVPAGGAGPAAAAPKAAPAAPAASAASAPAASTYPPHTPLAMPALSPTMAAGNIATFKVKVGDKLAPGDLICDIESDKATIGWESQEEGYVAAILVGNGAQEVKVGTPVLVLVDDVKDVPKFADYKAGAAPAAPAAAAKSAPAVPAHSPAAKQAQASPAAPPAAQTVARPAGAKVFASPLAKALAKEASIDLAKVAPSGPNNRVLAADVLQAIESGSAGVSASMPGQAVSGLPAGVPGQDFDEVPHSNIRKVIASRLLQAKTTVPHYYLTVDLPIDDLMVLREQLNAKASKDKEGKPAYKLSVNDFVIKACALSLKKHPEVNSSWMETVIRRYNYVDISVAVASPNGLITPIVTDADIKGLVAISQDVKALAEKARHGKLQPHEFQGGTFSVSNLGMFGVTGFSAIINPPQSCILAVGATEERVVPKKDGTFGVSQIMRVTLSCDHRTVDGAVGATVPADSARVYHEPY